LEHVIDLQKIINEIIKRSILKFECLPFWEFQIDYLTFTDCILFTCWFKDCWTSIPWRL